MTLLMQVPAAVAASVGKKAGILGRMGSGTFQSSTKIEALREEIGRMLQRDPSAKAIVFSQFTSMLDLVHHRLQQVGPLPRHSSVQEGSLQLGSYQGCLQVP